MSSMEQYLGDCKFNFLNGTEETRYECVNFMLNVRVAIESRLVNAAYSSALSAPARSYGHH